MEYDNECIKRLMLCLAEKISKSYSTIGFDDGAEDIVLLRGSRMDVLTEIADIFDNIEFLEGNRIAICEMPVSKGKFYLNHIAAFLTGRHGAIGPLSFTLGEASATRLCDGREMKIIRVNEGAVDLVELRNLFESFPAIRMQKPRPAKTIVSERCFSEAVSEAAVDVEAGI